MDTSWMMEPKEVVLAYALCGRIDDMPFQESLITDAVPKYCSEELPS